MNLICLILCALFVVLIIPAIMSIVYHQYVLRRKLKNIPQIGRFPFGVAFELMKMTSYERVQWFEKHMCHFKKGIFIFWIGMKPFIIIYKPEFLEIILNNTVNIEKGFPYEMLKSWLGKGLLTSTGKQWYHDRKLIGPTFHFSKLNQFAIVISEKAEILTKCLEKEVAKNPEKAINIVPFVNNVALDVICGKQKSKAFLDLLLDQNEKDDTPLTDDELRAQVDTFMFEGHDTTAVAIIWTLFLLGNNLEHQEKVHEELEEIFKDSKTLASIKELSQLKYLDMIIKETLRLFPSVPIITRKLAENVKMGNYTFPKDTTIVLGISLTHRNPEVWSDPKKFDPDRFLPDNSKHRNPYAYIPFSAGPRNCIGQKFALLEEKAILTAILRKWRVKSVKTIDTIQYGFTIVYRPDEDIFIHFTPKK
ncbi:hypothetical protein ACFW04_001335 [Cataglyphis niger]